MSVGSVTGSTPIADIFRATTFRWTLAVAAALLFQTLLVSSFFWWQTDRHAMKVLDQDLTGDCEELKGRDYPGLLDAITDRINGDLHRIAYAALFAADGRPILGNTAALPSRLPVDGRAHTVSLNRTLPSGLYPGHGRVVACRAVRGTTILLGHDLGELDYLNKTITRAIGLVALPALLISLTGGLLLSLRAQRRISQVQLTTERVIAGRLRERLPVFGSRDSFDRLSASVNRMLDRTEELMEELRGVGDDIAHELRTPLTRLRAGLERGCEEARTPEQFQEVGHRAVREIDHSLGTIAALLRIREIEQSRRRSEFTEVDLQRLVLDAADLYAPTAEARAVRIELDAPARVVVLGDVDLLMEAIANLVDNAIKFTPRGGRVVVSLRAQGEVATVTVADDGPGITLAERQSVLRRFHRGERSWGVPGHGIGLSLVAAIATLHDFRFVLSDAQPGCMATLQGPGRLA